jgi:hypothetical protein
VRGLGWAGGGGWRWRRRLPTGRPIGILKRVRAQKAKAKAQFKGARAFPGKIVASLLFFHRGPKYVFAAGGRLGAQELLITIK